MLRPVFDTSGGTDGFVSVEVAPELARETQATIAAARQLHERIDEPNLLVKIPATAQGLPAIQATTAEGRSINITLIFSLPRYAEVIEAYQAGLETFTRSGGNASWVHSVASFFVSRVDTEVDRRLEAIGSEEALALRGRAAVAQAKLAYRLFEHQFSGERWQHLAEVGAHRQRPLWASTSTKNPASPDTLYVDKLIGPDTVNTLPEPTIAAFSDHGTLARTLDSGVGRGDAPTGHRRYRHGRRRHDAGERGRCRFPRVLPTGAGRPRGQGGGSQSLRWPGPHGRCLNRPTPVEALVYPRGVHSSSR